MLTPSIIRPYLFGLSVSTGSQDQLGLARSSLMRIPREVLRSKKSPSLIVETLPILTLLAMASCILSGCQSQNAAGPMPPPEVEVATVIQKDVPIYGEW